MIPFYLVEKTTLKGGRRLPKRKSFVEPYAQPIGFHDRHLPAIYTSLNAAYKPGGATDDSSIYDSKLQFGNDEFRFWALDIEVPQSHIAVCRCCEAMEDKREKRKQHQKLQGCPTRLINAYKRLNLGNPRCVICDVFTSSCVWGVPLCASPICLCKWKFTPTPPALVEALRLSQ